MCEAPALGSIGPGPAEGHSPWTQNRSTALMMSLPSEPARIPRALGRIEAMLRSNHYGEKDVFAVKLALEEAMANAIRHGNRSNPNKNVSLYYSITPERCDLCVCDEGAGFDPAKMPTPENASDEVPGRGLMLMRHYMDNVIFHQPGNRVTLSKVRA